MSLFGVVKQARQFTNEVIVAFSGGKDSIAALDLCVSSFDRVQAYSLYMIKGLSFQERYFSYIERRYKIKIHRFPSWALADHLKDGLYRWHSDDADNCPRIKASEIKNAIQKQLGCEWIVTGEKKTDSLERRGQMWKTVQAGHDGIETERKLIWPLANWVNKDVYSYLKRRGIAIPHEYSEMKYSYQGTLFPEQLRWIKANYPDDWNKIKETFPFAEASIVRDDIRKAKQVSEVPDSNDPQEFDQRGAVQPANHRQARKKETPGEHSEKRARRHDRMEPKNGPHRRRASKNKRDRRVTEDAGL